MKALFRIAACLFFHISAGHLIAGEIKVLADKSLADSLKESTTTYEKTSGDKVSFTFAASNVLVQQIKSGTQADVVFLSDKSHMDDLQSASLLLRGSRMDLLGDSLVVVTATDGPGISRKEDFLRSSVTRLSLGDPSGGGPGLLAKEWLRKFDLWDKLRPKLVAAGDSRGAMAMVESGHAEAAIICKSDARNSAKIIVAFEIPDNEGSKIVYPAAVLKSSGNEGSARKFITWLSTAEASRTFRKFGFSISN